MQGGIEGGGKPKKKIEEHSPNPPEIRVSEEVRAEIAKFVTTCEEYFQAHTIEFANQYFELHRRQPDTLTIARVQQEFRLRFSLLVIDRGLDLLREKIDRMEIVALVAKSVQFETIFEDLVAYLNQKRRESRLNRIE